MKRLEDQELEPFPETYSPVDWLKDMALAMLLGIFAGILLIGVIDRG